MQEMASDVLRSDTYSLESIAWALKNLDWEDYTFLSGPVMEEIRASRKIDAIKAIRERYRIGLKGAKAIADVMGEPKFKVQRKLRHSAELIDAVERVESACRDAIKAAVGDTSTVSELCSIRQHLTGLWERVIGAVTEDDKP